MWSNGATTTTMATWAWRALYGAGAHPIAYVSPQPRGAESFLQDTVELPPNAAPRNQLIHVVDDWPGTGPLGAIVSALRFARRSGFNTAVSVACDVPLVTSSQIDALHRHLATARRSFAVASDGERDHWSVLAIDVNACIDVLEAGFLAGERAIHRAFAHIPGVRVVMAPHVLHNVNEMQMLTSPSEDR